jgi:iron complex outermembrane recepter protein
LFSTDCSISGRAGVSLLCAALFAVQLSPAQAQRVDNASGISQAGQDYAIPAGPLATTLKTIASTSGRIVRFEARDVQGRQAPALAGRLTAVAAVQAAIADTGLTMASMANGDLAVFVPQLDTMHVVATRDQAESGFKASSSDTATRSGTDLLDVPQAVTVITAKVIETQQAQTVQDVLQNVSGVVTRESAQGMASYSIRGFSQTAALSNGVVNPYASSVNIANVERIEVLKGPQAILSGGDSLGGAVNIVTKKPSADTIRDLSLQYGSHADKRGTVDLSGAVTEDKRLSYRLIGSSARADHNDAGYDGRASDSALAELRWKDEATDALVGASYDNQYQPPNRYTFALNGGIQKIPGMRLGQVDDGIRIRNKAVFYSVEHAFAPWLTVVSRMQRTLTHLDLDLYAPQYPRSTANMIIAMYPTSNLSDYRTTSGDHYLRMTFDTGPLAHRLSTGVNHTRMDTDTNSYAASTSAVPVYQSAQYDFTGVQRSASTLYTAYRAATRQYGLFAQDLIGVGDWHALLGVRRSRYESGPASTVYTQTAKVVNGVQSSLERTTPNAGLVYSVTPNVALYGSYTEGFLPQFVTVKNCSTGGSEFPPMQTRNKEAGIKVDRGDGSVSWTAAVYQLDQSNVLQYDSAGACYGVRAAQRVKGVETEAAGQVLPGWNVIFNYTYADAQDIGKSTNLPAAQPRHQASVWSTYDVQSGRLRGFGAALGVTGYSWTRLGTTSASVTAPGAARVDAGLSYQGADWSLRLGVKNLFDRTLYGYSTSVLYVPVLEGRTITATWLKHF